MSDTSQQSAGSLRLAPLKRVVELALKISKQRKERVVIVGGFVRDLLMQRSVGDYDLDLVVEGDGLAFSQALQDELGGERREFLSFLTSKLSAPFKCEGGEAPFLSEVDIATARSEEYTRPGALPVVKPTTIRRDLKRRDFSTNAMALPLNFYIKFLSGSLSHDALAGKVIDPCGGLTDLHTGTLRILHPQSFIDDPTRLFRAARYLVRLSFDFDMGTLSAFYEAVKSGALSTLSPRRVWNEVVCALDENEPSEVIREFCERGLFSNLPIVEEARLDSVGEALTTITVHRSRVSPADFVEAAKLVILAFLLDCGREDVAQATSEGGRMLKRAKGALTGQRPGLGPISPAEALAAFAFHRDDAFLVELRGLSER